MNYYEKHEQMYNLIRLGLWEQALIYGGDSTVYIKDRNNCIQVIWFDDPATKAFLVYKDLPQRGTV